jgi:uncharacterized protein (TIGR03435 family)
MEQFRLSLVQPLIPSAQVGSAPSPAPMLPIGIILVAGLWLCGSLAIIAHWFSDWRRISSIARSGRSVSNGREFSALRRAEYKSGLRISIPLIISPRELEPGVFGIFRPALLWPDGLSSKLDDSQIEAIMMHEVEHVRRRDNLTAAIHAFVEAIFWFHPVVRWMSARMSEERERACDEKVLQENSRPETYAQSILTVCSLCMEPAAPCVSGVSAGNLKQRILRIMTRGSATALTPWRKAALAAAAVLIVALPFGFGVVHGQAITAANPESGQTAATPHDLPKYDVASIKPNKTGDGRVRFMMTPDGISLQGAPMRMLLTQAFGVEEDRILGEPDWVKSNRYDIEAKVEAENAPKLKDLKAEQRNAMMLQLLVDRFNLKYHHEQRELPMYALVVAKSGLKMKPTKPDPNDAEDDAPPPKDAPKPGDGPQPRMGKHMLMMNPGHLESSGTTSEMLAHLLSRQLSRTVVDKTGLTGEYDFTLNYTPDNMPMPMHGGPEGGPKPEMQVDAGGPSIFTAVEEQLGLKLEATKGMVDVIVIDHIDLPSEN